MKIKKSKQKKFSKEFELKGDQEGGFILRITESRIDLETRAKDWKIVFAAGTYEYAYIFHMLKSQEMKGLHSIAVAIFLTRYLFRDAQMIQDMFLLSETVAARIAARQAAPEQTDEEILAEEKALHEQTPESVRELEELKETTEENGGNTDDGQENIH